MTLHDADTAVKLRQDSDPYCLLLLGLVVFSSYVFNFFYLSIILPAAWITIAQYFLFLVGLPLVIIFFLVHCENFLVLVLNRVSVARVVTLLSFLILIRNSSIISCTYFCMFILMAPGSM